ncbi:biphenyl 2,3-dioxygenase [Photobacterium jeanii]|uniref:Biphenyl 2,3-dioxygenase n=1 Tax=Photobacterium jeanii TaxID=858640 RepID=A0A178K2G6_9GAMM|nr:GNAT family N-acetyltransferase [Photobacterium jeanii]OAN10902.1 biphenyl 2,3-dioxygenase [Photobacterium jeanii]PST90417.1 N-acetyltransferase [Photobacterium jeanii]
MEYQFDLSPSDDDIKVIRDGLIRHNTPHLEGIRKQSLALYAIDEREQKQGGIYAEVWGNWLLIKFLWVDEAVRGQQVGSQLMERLEQQAIKLGCRQSLVDTLSFQARPFYEKLGYQCQMTLEDYPQSSSLHFLTKTLSA